MKSLKHEIIESLKVGSRVRVSPPRGLFNVKKKIEVRGNNGVLAFRRYTNGAVVPANRARVV